MPIGGSGPSGGAGVQRDVKSFTAQSTIGFTGVHAVPADFVAEQIRTLMDDVRIDAIKIGTLASGSSTTPCCGNSCPGAPHRGTARASEALAQVTAIVPAPSTATMMGGNGSARRRERGQGEETPAPTYPGLTASARTRKLIER